MLTTLAGIADLLAAAGVIGSLIFLGVQLRDQNRETGLNNWRELLVTLTDFKGITNDPRMAELVVRGHADYQALSAAERLSFGMYLEQGIHIIGNFDKHSGTVPGQMKDLHYPVQNLMLDHIATPGARAWWAESKPKGRFLPATAATIDRLQAEGVEPIGPHLG
jgi:hypothetical protein